MTDRDHFAAAVMNWISEATSLIQWRSDGGRKIMSDACQQCWTAYEQSPPGSSNRPISGEAERQSPASECGGGEPLDVTRPDNGEAAGGRGRNTQEPFAWAADIPGKFGGAPTVLFGYTKNLVQSIAAAGDLVEPFPLYRQPQTCPYVVGRTTLHCSLTPLTLTDAEREAIEWYAGYGREGLFAGTLRKLLERTKCTQ